MNHFTDEPTQNFDADNRLPTPEMPPVNMKAKRQQLEDSIRRSKSNLGNPCIAPTSNFDALNYASLASVPRTEAFAEADPYVNPVDAESGLTNSIATSDHSSRVDIPAAQTIDDILERLTGYQSEIQSLETESMETQSIGVPEFDSELSMENQLFETDSTKPCSNLVVPLVDASDDSPEFQDPVYDVRDFSDSASGVIEPIPGTQEFEPDFFEFHVVEEHDANSSVTTPSQADRPSTLSGDRNSVEIEVAESSKELPANGQCKSAPIRENQLFVASTGDVITIDGDDGFGYIDLACFDVRQATFEKQTIKVDDGEGTVFEIHHNNIPYVLFCDGVEVDLTPDGCDDQVAPPK